MFRKLLAIFVSLLIILVMVVLLWLTSLERRLFDPNFYDHLISESGLYELIVSQGWQALERGTPPESRAFVQGLGFGRFNQAVRMVAPPEFLAAQLSPAAVSLRGWLRGNAPTEDLQINIELQEFRRRFPVVMHELVQDVVRTMPECSAEELRQLQVGGSSWCRPAFWTAAEFSRRLEKDLSFGEAAKRLPERLSLVELLRRPDGKVLQSRLLAVRDNYQLARQLLRYAWMGLGVLWFLLILLLVPWWRLLIEWLGSLVVAIGGLQLALYVSLPWLTNFIWQQTAAGWPSAARLEVEQIVGVSEIVLKSVHHEFFIWGVILLASGVVVWLAGRLIKKPQSS